MRDDEMRDKMHRFVYSSLRRASFRELLPERTDTGEHPLVLALSSDAANQVLDRVVESGSRANVIVGHPDYLLIAPICVVHGPDADDDYIKYHVESSETIIEFLDRVQLTDEAAAMIDAVHVGRGVRMPTSV